MNSARGQANHSLYLARILIQAWRRQQGEEVIPASVLAQAYLPAARAHLRNAYGWFLLEITRPGALPETPPGGIAELPEIAPGKAVPGELREFQQLEASGWIAEMLAAETAAPSPQGSSGNLLTGAAGAGPESAQRWVDLLQGLFDRMGDSLDEY